MINSYAYDVEILPNLFSVTIVNLNDYLNKFADCVDKKGKPIPMIQLLSVKEIKDRLDSVESWSYVITDTDDSQLLEMLAHINRLAPYRDSNGKAVASHVFGYNSMSYDKLMIAAFLMFATNCNNTKELIKKLYDTSKKIIELQDNKEMARRDYYLQSLREYKLPYKDIDVMRIFALNKCGKGINANGETVYFPKSLKQTSINLQWYELLEYELPPISDKDADIYRKDPTKRGMSVEQLNKLIEKWDRYILPEWIPDELHYNKNDVFIVCEIVRLNMDEIKARYSITRAYEVDVLNSSRSNISDILFEKFYSEFSGLKPSQWKGKKTERTKMAFKRVIFPWINFKTEPLKELLAEMKQVIITSLGKKALKQFAVEHPNFKYLKYNNESGWFEIKLNKLVYTIATGGLHSQDIPRELRSNISFTGEGKLTDKDIWSKLTDDSFIYVHYDIASFYPSLMVEHKVSPAHLNEGVFCKLVGWLRDTRVQAKHSKEEYIDGIPKDVLALVLKIVINSIYGKLGYEYGDICDRLAVLNVTINGQLMIMMLCEELELNGIEVVSANTDGIVVKLYPNKKPVFDEITKNWEKLTKFGADAEEYKCYINRDINNYTIEELNGKRTYKGALNPYMYLIDLQKGYDMPIVAQAVVNYFLDDKPIMETLYECRNILDFCKTQNIGRQFHVEVSGIDNDGQIGFSSYQRNIRYYVSNKGYNLFKTHNITNKRSNLCAGNVCVILNTVDDMRIELRDINYTYYYNECLKIIDPIKLRISPKGKGRAIIKKNGGQYESLFDDNDFID